MAGRALPGAQDAILDAVLARARAAPGAIAVFDLDSTLLDNRPRQARILHDFGRERGVPELLDARPEHWTSWDLEDALRNAGLRPARAAALLAAAWRFWSERFFTSAYCRLDAPLPGAAAFLADLVRAAARIAYVTGRLARMKEGTLETFARAGFPMPGAPGHRLLMKPRESLGDDAWKRLAAAELAREGEVFAAFDNEPAHVNAYREAFPDALCVHLDTDHSGRPIPVHPRIPSIRDFTRRAEQAMHAP